MIGIALPLEDHPPACLAQLRRGLDERVQDYLQVEGGPANDLEDVSRGGLLLKRFAQLAEQPRVLDGDDGLSGEVSNQLDLLIRERPHLLTEDGDEPD